MLKIRDWMPRILCGKIMPHNTIPAESGYYVEESHPVGPPESKGGGMAVRCCSSIGCGPILAAARRCYVERIVHIAPSSRAAAILSALSGNSLQHSSGAGGSMDVPKSFLLWYLTRNTRAAQVVLCGFVGGICRPLVDAFPHTYNDMRFKE